MIKNTEKQRRGKGKNLYKQFSRAFLIFLMFTLTLFSLNFVSAGLWDDNLVSFYSLNGTTGNVTDSLLVNNGTNNGADRGIAGILNNSFDFELGETDSVTIDDGLGTIASIETGNLTINAWIKTETTGASMYIMGGGINGSGVYIKSGNDIAFGKTAVDEVVSTDLVQDGVWTMITVTYDQSGNSVQIYLNGTADSGGADAYSTEFDNVTYRIGAAGHDAAHFDGLIDEVGIWGRVLNTSEISDLYNSGIGLPYGGGIFVAPVVTLNSPVDTYNTTSSSITFNCSASDDINLVNVSLYIDGVINETNSSGLNNTNYIFTKTVNVGTSNWTCGGVDNSSQSTIPTARDFTFANFEELSQTFNSSTYETSSETFNMNISVNTTRFTDLSVTLKYNGSSYAGSSSCIGTTCTVASIIDIPLVTTGSGSENKDFYWAITLFDGESSSSITQNSSTNTQNVSEINMSLCGTGAVAVNYTIYKEDDSSILSADFKGSFKYYLGGGTIYRSTSVDTTASSVSLCIAQNETFITDVQIDLSQTNYADRRYDFVSESYTNSTTNVTLYLVNSTISSNIIIEVRDEGLSPQSGIRVNISRYFPETDTWKIVESQVTDNFGQFVAKLIQNDVKYQFQFWDSSGTLLKTSDDIKIICRATICVLPFVIETTVDEFEDFEDIALFTSDLSFDSTNNRFVFSWDDQTGNSITMRLEVTRFLLNGSTLVCNTTSTSVLSTLTCDVGSTSATYKVQAFRKVSGEREQRKRILTYKVGDPYDTYGLEGLLWVFILLFTCIGIGAFNPTIGISLYGVGFIMMGVLGIISMPISVFFANTTLVVVFIWSIKT